jgi:hypothetical protein
MCARQFESAQCVLETRRHAGVDMSREVLLDGHTMVWCEGVYGGDVQAPVCWDFFFVRYTARFMLREVLSWDIHSAVCCPDGLDVPTTSCVRRVCEERSKCKRPLYAVRKCTRVSSPSACVDYEIEDTGGRICTESFLCATSPLNSTELNTKNKWEGLVDGFLASPRAPKHCAVVDWCFVGLSPSTVCPRRHERKMAAHLFNYHLLSRYELVSSHPPISSLSHPAV